MARAVALLEAGRAAEAETLLRDILERAPGHGPAHFQLGRLALERGDLEAARRHLAAAVARPLPRPYLAWQLLAVAEDRAGETPAAARAWEEAARRAAAALERQPDFPPALRVAIAAAEARDDLWAALDGYARLLRRYPEAPSALGGAARTALALGAVDRALCLVGRALAGAPLDPALLELRASVELAAGDPVAAAAAARAALGAGGPRAPLEILLGQALLAALDTEAAVAAYRRALEVDPTVLDRVPPLVFEALAEDDPAALTARLSSAAPDDPAALRGLAAAARAADDPAAARPALEALARRAPDDAALHYQLGQVYLRLGEVALGRQAMARFERLKASEDAAWEHHNAAFRRRLEAEERGVDDPAAALGIYRALAAEGLAEREDYLAAGRLLLAREDFAAAAAWFEEVVRSTPYDRQALEGLLAAAQGAGRSADAGLYRGRLELVAGLCGEASR